MKYIKRNQKLFHTYSLDRYIFHHSYILSPDLIAQNHEEVIKQKSLQLTKVPVSFSETIAYSETTTTTLSLTSHLHCNNEYSTIFTRSPTQKERLNLICEICLVSEEQRYQILNG